MIKKILKTITMIKLSTYIITVLVATAVSISTDMFVQSKKLDYFAEDVVQVIDSKASPIVRLESKQGGHCTGFVVSDKLIMTAAHCIIATEREANLTKKEVNEFVSGLKAKVLLLTVTQPPFYQHTIRTLETKVEQLNAIDDKLVVSTYKVIDSTGKITSDGIAIEKSTSGIDYGYIKGDFSKFRALKLSRTGKTVELFDSLVFCGYPRKSQSAMCQKVDFKQYSTFSILTTGHLMPGFSGSPLFNSKGEVVGVASSVTNGGILYFASTLGALP